MAEADLNRPPNLIPPFGRQGLSAGHLSKLSRAINRGASGVVPPYQLLPERTDNGNGPTFAVMTIAAVHYNWLDCTIGDTHYKIARPALNRRDSPEGGNVAAGSSVGTRVDNGVTYTLTYTGAQSRGVTGGTISGTENQIIGPTQYAVNDKVLVAFVPMTVNGDSTGTTTCDGVALDARCWGTVPS